jgi:hypothetical protein
MITVYIIFSYIIMLSAVFVIKTRGKFERLFMFLIAPVSLPIFIGFVLASLIDKIEDK